jgi:hypothetical protein
MERYRTRGGLSVALPVGVCLLMRHAAHASLVASLTVSSIALAIRTVTAAVRQRRQNALATLTLTVSVAGIGLTSLTGNARLMIAKESVVSGVLAAAILVSVRRGRPLMTAGLKPYLTRADAARITAFDQLSLTSRLFRRYELRFSWIWGACLLTDCVARLVGAFTLPVSLMSWLGTTFSIAGVVAAMVIAGGAAAAPIDQLISGMVKDSGGPGSRNPSR